MYFKRKCHIAVNVELLKPIACVINSLLSFHPAKIVYPKMPEGSITLVVRSVIKVKIFHLPNIVNEPHKLKDSTDAIPRTHVVRPVIIDAAALLYLVFSISIITTGSAIERDDVHAANNISKKNMLLKMLPKGICENATGKI